MHLGVHEVLPSNNIVSRYEALFRPEFLRCL